MIQYLLFIDDNIRYQPFDQLFHHEMQDRNLVETDGCFIKKIEEYTSSCFLHQDCLYVGITHTSTGARQVHDYFHTEFPCIWKPLPAEK